MAAEGAVQRTLSGAQERLSLVCQYFKVGLVWLTDAQQAIHFTFILLNVRKMINFEFRKNFRSTFCLFWF